MGWANDIKMYSMATAGAVLFFEVRNRSKVPSGCLLTMLNDNFTQAISTLAGWLLLFWQSVTSFPDDTTSMAVVIQR